MYKKSLFSWIVAGVLIVGLAGCESMEKKARVKPVEISPFLEHPELLVAQEPTFPFHYFYLKKDAGVYENIYIAPVNLDYLRKNVNWAAMEESVAKKIGSDIKGLGEFMQQAYQKEFQNVKTEDKLKVVDSPKGAKTLILESAIVALKPTKAEVNIVGTAGNVFLPGIGVLAGQLAAGSVTIECMIKDAKTGEIVAMYANTEKDQRAVLNFAGMTWYTSSERNITRQAEYTARIFSGADYTKMRRKLIKFIAL